MFSKIKNSLIILISVIALLVVPINSFNLSPIPNIVYQEPLLESIQQKPKSSYFGFTLSLRTNSIIVGAPRANSSFKSQSDINEIGAIYKCKIDRKICKPYVFDATGNILEQPGNYPVQKNYQWLGMSMDGNNLDTDSLVVCSPRTIGEDELYRIHGACYWTPNTTETLPLNVKKFVPLRLWSKQDKIIDNFTYPYYMYGESGVSVHITANNEEIIIGAPGILKWAGSIIRYRLRDNFTTVQIPDIPKQPNDTYFGYAVTSGYFGDTKMQKLLYLAGAPRANDSNGVVYIFDIVVYSKSTKTKTFYNFTSEQMGSYFGYALITEDFNGDGLTDVAVGAPLYRLGSSYDNGAVFIYLNQGQKNKNKLELKFTHAATLTSDYNSNGRFGTAISKIGDINQDGFNDIAIGAPYEGNGAVYIYFGESNGIALKPSQKLTAPSNSNANQFMPHMFGHGLSKGVDIDQNNYLDFAVGAPNTDAVYIYKSYPVVKVIANVIPQKKIFKITDKSFVITICWLFESKFDISIRSTVNISLIVDQHIGRAQFNNKKCQFDLIDIPISMIELCRNLTVDVELSNANIFKPLEIVMHYKVLNTPSNLVARNTSSIKFCTSCVAVNPIDPKFVTNKVIFITECKGEKCIADLSITGNVIQQSLPYILGSSGTLSLVYKIQNYGETAYLPQIRIEIPSNVAFSIIPSSCIMNNDDLLCDIINGSPLFNNISATFKVTLNTTKLGGKKLVIKANVSCAGYELNNEDNFVETIIPLTEIIIPYKDNETYFRRNTNSVIPFIFDDLLNLLGSYSIWIYSACALASLLTLILITYGLYKAGFFKRTIKEKKEKIIHEGLTLNEEDIAVDTSIEMLHM